MSRGITVAREVSRRGPDVLFMGYWLRFADHVRDAGFAFKLLEPGLTEADADAVIAVDQERAQAWPTSDGQRMDSYGYAILRPDFESGTTTPAH